MESSTGPRELPGQADADRARRPAPSWLPILGWCVLCALLVATFFQVRRGSDPAPQHERLVAASQESLEQRLAALEQRLRDLEAQPASPNGQGTPAPARPGAAVEQPAVGAPEGDTPPAEEPWKSLDGPGTPPAGKTADANGEPASSSRWEEVLENRDPKWAGLAARTSGGISPEIEAAIAEAKAQEEAARLAATAPREVVPEHPEIVAAVNQLLVDTGLFQYQCLRARLPVPAEPGSTSPPEKGLQELSFAERGPEGELIGNLQARSMCLEYFEPRRAHLILEDARGLRGTMRLEYPRRQLVLEIPGLMDAAVVDERILGALWRSESEVGDQQVTDGQGAVRRTNEVLGSIENLPMRLRSVQRLQDALLCEVIVDLEFDPQGRPTRTIEADTAWWELYPESAYVELHCEGGSQTVLGKSRPLFRGHYKHPLRNVQPKIWERLPAVRVRQGGVPPGE